MSLEDPSSFILPQYEVHSTGLLVSHEKRWSSMPLPVQLNDLTGPWFAREAIEEAQKQPLVKQG